jgi:hypothetical protein
MQPHLTLLLARARQRDLNAAARGRVRDIPSRPLLASIAVRLATANDRGALERLAALDSTEPPRGSTLVGELLQRPVAAMSLSDGRVIADPFVATADVVALLRLRARQLRARRPRRRRKRGAYGPLRHSADPAAPHPRTSAPTAAPKHQTNRIAQGDNGS